MVEKGVFGSENLARLKNLSDSVSLRSKQLSALKNEFLRVVSDRGEGRIDEEAFASLKKSYEEQMGEAWKGLQKDLSELASAKKAAEGVLVFAKKMVVDFGKGS